MLRPFPALPLAVLVTLVAAQPAPASRIYAGQPRASVPTELVLSVSDSGSVLKKVIFHFDISCGTTYRSVDSGSTIAVAAEPYALYFGDHYLVGARMRGSRVTGTILGVDQVTDTDAEVMTVALSGTIGATKAHGTMVVDLVEENMDTGAVGTQCTRTVHWNALRDPGVIFAGITSADEPIALELLPDRRHVRHVHLAWTAPCASGGTWVDAHDEFDLKPYALSQTGAFSRVYRTSLGNGSGLVERFAGRINGRKASGTFQSDVTLEGTDGRDTCASGRTSWTATSG